MWVFETKFICVEQQGVGYPPSNGESSLLGSVTETLASLNDSEEEGGLTPPPTKRPRLSTGGSLDRGGPSSSSPTSNTPNEERTDLIPSSEAIAGAAEPSAGSGAGVAMQSNGVIHENGTSDFSVNGVGGVVKSNGCGDSLINDDKKEMKMKGRGGMDPALTSRRRKTRPLSAKDTDTIRLIGQHLREMGFE